MTARSPPCVLCAPSTLDSSHSPRSFVCIRRHGRYTIVVLVWIPVADLPTFQTSPMRPSTDRAPYSHTEYGPKQLFYSGSGQWDFFRGLLVSLVLVDRMQCSAKNKPKKKKPEYKASVLIVAVSVPK